MALRCSMYACLLLLLFALANATESAEDPSYGSEKGFGVGIVYRPPNCKRVTKHGDHVSVRYNGTFIDGTTYVPPGDKPFDFTLGERQVIEGWDIGLLDMCVGEIRHLVVPSTVGYGGWPIGDKVPPKSTIEFFVEVLAIKDTFKEADMISDTFIDIDINKDLLLSHDEVARYLKKQNFPDGKGDKSHSHILKEIFVEEDKDSDGKISHNEFSGPKKYIGDL